MGDTDYGLRAKEQGYTCWIVPGYIGACKNNSETINWASEKLTLSERKKTMTRDVLKKFAWLSYEYYPLHMPDSIKKTRWQSEWRHLSENKSFVAEKVPSILSEIT